MQYPIAANNYTWYRKYTNGWVEQGGMFTGEQYISFPVAMKNTGYTVTTSSDYYTANRGTPIIVSYGRTTTGAFFQPRWDGAASSAVTGWWKIEGEGA